MGKKNWQNWMKRFLKQFHKLTARKLEILQRGALIEEKEFEMGKVAFTGPYQELISKEIKNNGDYVRMLKLPH
jgi:hypothetical protein